MYIQKIKQKFIVGLPTLLIHKFPPYAYMDSWYAQSFNGQIRRAAKIVEIAGYFNPTSIIETGTFLGSSTPALSCMTSGRVFTFEINKKFAAKAQARFDRNHKGRNIQLLVGDSTKLMENLFSKIQQDDTDSRILCYLDAHWETNIPTSEEISILDRNFANWIAIIDDFKIEADSGYGFDSYSTGTVDLSVIPSDIDVEVWVPNENSNLESGAKRGTAYVFSPNAVKMIPSHVFRNLSRIK